MKIFACQQYIDVVYPHVSMSYFTFGAYKLISLQGHVTLQADQLFRTFLLPSAVSRGLIAVWMMIGSVLHY